MKQSDIGPTFKCEQDLRKAHDIILGASSGGLSEANIEECLGLLDSIIQAIGKQAYIKVLAGA